ncbi:MAG TPA: phosphatase PAP2 family protein [Opitutaceae bacterium]|nr:phosphatase PAP2 family protein [Opitutaceae bacterium]
MSNRRGGGLLESVTRSFKKFFRNSGWNEFVVLLSALVVCACLLLFADLADDVPEGGFEKFDTRLLRAMRHADDLSKPIGPLGSVEVARDITALGGATVLTLVNLLVIGYLLLRRSHRKAVLILCATLGGYALSNGLKVFFGRPRPDVVPHLAEVVSASFPSGHSMLSSVVYLTLGALLARIAVARREKVYVICASFLLTGLIGVSRVYLGVHYPTDVLAGWAAGTAWALLCWLAALALQRSGTFRSENNGAGGGGEREADGDN